MRTDPGRLPGDSLTYGRSARWLAAAADASGQLRGSAGRAGDGDDADGAEGADSADSAGSGDPDVHRWLRLHSVIDGNPGLKLYCATRPVVTVDADATGGPVVRLPVPYPPHPGHPAGTGWVSGAELVGNHGATIRELVANRADHRERPLDHLTEYVVRPLVVVLRELVDDAGDELFTIDPLTAGFEVTQDGRLTGRIVIGTTVEVGRWSPGVGAVAAEFARGLDRFLDRLAGRIAGLGWADQARDHAGQARDHAGQAMDHAGQAGSPAAGRTAAARARIDEVIAKELRFLRPETAAVLGGDAPWARFVHTVGADQDRMLRSVLRTVAERSRLRRADPWLPVPLVAVDPRLAGARGLRRFAWDVCDAGGDLVDDPPAAEDTGRVVARFADAGGSIMVSAGGHRQPVATLETLPRARQPAGVRPVPALSYTRSLEELQLAEMRTYRLAGEYVVRLSARQSVELVGQLTARADQAAERAADAAASAIGPADGDAGPPEAVIPMLIRHLLTRKQFIKGSRGYYSIEQAESDMREFVLRSEPIQFRMMGFPLKQRESGLKALGGLPDIAELGALIRLRELHGAIRRVYRPGIRLTVLTDASHFRPRPPSVTLPYERKLNEYARLVDCHEFVRFVDVDEYAETELAVDRDEHAKRASHHGRLLRAGFAGMDITRDPLTVLRQAEVAELRSVGDHDGGLARPVFRDLFMSIVFSVPVPLLDGLDRMESSKAIYDDLYRVGGGVPADIAAARRSVLMESWDATIKYVSTLRADRDLGYDDLFNGCVRLKAGAPRPGTCGFCFLGGSSLLPWQGTGAVSARGEVSTDFAVSLFDQGFVPVFSPLLGDDQPWMMVPVTATHVVAGGSAAQLDGRFVERIRLRRK